eukprot:CAMPEP_0181102566 /NCGR_PEP_ID=MMETSP1071-20121207/14389_1 /TAXON_ID=35127 /ORGANISM="Thalassiosira sp., Strain NH16" /LENGTH=807 /DNA_ID=CAMNT_0023185559 /DNA_START=52 /DNA_END=2475 /DNA_ORIENTATION=-
MTMAGMKSTATIVCTILLSSHSTRATRAPFHRGGLFQRPGWRRRSTARQSNTALILFPRGGDDVLDSAVAEEATSSSATEDQSLDDRVNAAMRRLGLGGDDATTESSSVSESSPPPPPPPPVEESGMNCEGGVCTLDKTEAASTANTSVSDAAEESGLFTEENMYATADRISTEMNVPKDIVLAAIYSSFSGTDDNRQINAAAARSIVQSEVDAIANVPEECAEVTQLMEEGFEAFFVRRSLAFSEMNVDNARAILMADREDEEAEREEMEASQAKEEAVKEEPEMKTVTVDYPKDFNPLASAAAASPQPKPQKPEGAPTLAKKEDVIFEGTTEDLQKLVIESPVPVLLDVYADWCGPCKQLTPALEQICINAGGMLRLVKIDTDQQRQISGALEVKALPTIFGIRDGKILNSFQGMPRDEQMLRDFLMGLMVPGQNFKPPVSAEDKGGYDDLSNKLLKLAAGASFSFSARERLQSHMGKLLDQLVETIGGETGMAIADDSARVLRSLMSNVIANPFEDKFRKIKLDNKVIAAKVAQHQPCLSILKSIGFSQDGELVLAVAKGKRVVNIAPFVVGRDCIDKWIDKNRYEIAKAGRKRSDEMERARLAAKAEEAAENEPDEEEEVEEEDDEDPTLCVLKVRLEGKKKVHDIEMNANDSLSHLLERLPFPMEDGDTVQFTCVAKRLIVKSTDPSQMSKTLSQLCLMPSASIVVKLGEGKKTDIAKGSLAERAASHKKKSSGSHSMHSIGLYAKDDGNKAETFESGGVLYDHVLTDDENEDDEDEDDEGGGAGEKDDSADSEEQVEENEQ